MDSALSAMFSFELASMTEPTHELTQVNSRQINTPVIVNELRRYLLAVQTEAAKS